VSEDQQLILLQMLLVCLLQKENLLAIYIVCKGRIFFVEYLSNATYINRVWVKKTLSKKANNKTVLEFIFCFSVHNRFIHSLFFVLFTLCSFFISISFLYKHYCLSWYQSSGTLDLVAINFWILALLSSSS